MTAFATHPGAFSRESISAAVRNGFFTGALKTRLRSQGKSTDIRQLMGSVRDDVLEATGGRQQPYTAGSLHGDLCLVVPSEEMEPVRPACVTAQHPRTRRFINEQCSTVQCSTVFQITIGFRASIQAGNLEALLRHLSSGESPSQSFVRDDTVFFGCLAWVLCLWCFLRACRWTRTQVSNSPRTLNLTIFSGRQLDTTACCGLLRPSRMRKGSSWARREREPGTGKARVSPCAGTMMIRLLHHGTA
jgi:hypothetical protein